MVDKISEARRSWNMSRIKAQDTIPEVKVRSLIHRAGYRFRKNVKNLPGKPDVVLRKHNTIVFVHGCFWHQHEGCKEASIPKSRTEFWTQKLMKNMERDKRQHQELIRLGWNVVTIWECETKKVDILNAVIKERVIPNLKEGM